MLSLVAAWLSLRCICTGFVASRFLFWGLAITWMSTYKSVSMMSLGMRDANYWQPETNPSSFTPFHHVPIDSQEELAELSAQIGSGLGCLYCILVFYACLQWFGLGLMWSKFTGSRSHDWCYLCYLSLLMFFVEFLSFEVTSSLMSECRNWGLAGEPLRQVFHSVMELWEVMWSSKREMDQNTILGHYTRAGVLVKS